MSSSCEFNLAILPLKITIEIERFSIKNQAANNRGFDERARVSSKCQRKDLQVV